MSKEEQLKSEWLYWESELAAVSAERTAWADMEHGKLMPNIEVKRMQERERRATTEMDRITREAKDLAILPFP